MTYKELRCLKCTDRMVLKELDDINIDGLSTPEFLFNCMECLYKIPDNFQLKDYFQSIEGIFSDCHSLKEIPDLNTSFIKNMNYAFYKCNSLEALPKMDTSNVISMDSMFKNCYNLSKVTLDISSMTTATDIFKGCNKLKSIVFKGKETKFDDDIDLNDTSLTYAAIVRMIKSLPEFKSDSSNSRKCPTLIIDKLKSVDKITLDDVTLVYHKGWRLKIDEKKVG